MHLCLVQHGEAQPKAVDPERRLTEKGAREVRRLAEFLRPAGLAAGTVWHSGKPRARETAELLAPAFSAGDAVGKREGLGPKDPVGPVAEDLRRAGTDTVIVGHQPFLGKLASLLLTGDEGRETVAFRYGCIVCLEGEETGPWKVSWMLAPDLVEGSAKRA